MDKEIHLTVIDVCTHVGISEHELYELLEQGLLTDRNAQTHFDATQLVRIQKAIRLQHDLGINTPGAVLALELFDEISKLQQALDILSRHL
jgi:chaperone modulatory protein CbpM